jgi:hypothetical protein
MGSTSWERCGVTKNNCRQLGKSAITNVVLLLLLLLLRQQRIKSYKCAN